MRMSWLMAVITITCVSGVLSVVAADRPGPVVQPTDEPAGKWKLHDNPMPPVESIVARPLEARPIYGLYGWRGEYQTFRDSIRKVGYRSYRLSGPFGDKTMTMIVADDMEVMVTLAHHLVTPEGRVRKNRTHFESDQAYIDAYIEYVDEFLTRYGPGGTFFADNPKLPNRPIMYVEILNEPNFQYVIPPREGVDRKVVEAEREALYAQLLPRTYKAITAKWPAVTVVGFGAGGAGNGDVRFISSVHKLNPAVGAGYDVLSTHPYSKPVPLEVFQLKEKWGPGRGWSVIESQDLIRQAMAAGGAKGKPIWWTELGWPISNKDGGRFAPPRAKGPFTPILLQGAYIVRSYAMALRLGVGRVHIMHATDTDRFNGGVFTKEGVWRPAAYATQTMIKLMPHPKLVAAIHDGDDGLYAYRFEADATDNVRTPVVMAWNVTGPKTIEIRAPRGNKTLVAVDMLGHRTPLTITEGKVSVDVGPCPVYVMIIKIVSDPRTDPN